MMALRASASRFVRPAVQRLAGSRPVMARPLTVSTKASAEEGVDQPSMAAAASIKLYCGNLSWDTQRDDLEDLFSKFGQVSDAFVATDRESGRSRGFGFVTMDKQGGDDAIAELNETDFMGRTIRVNEAQPMAERTPRNFGGRGGGYGGRGGSGYGGRGGGGGSYGERRGSYGGGGRGGGGGGGGYGRGRGYGGGGDGGY